MDLASLLADLPALLVAVVVVYLLHQLSPTLRTYLANRIRQELDASLRQDLNELVGGLLRTMDDHEALLAEARRILSDKYPTVNVQELDAKLRLTLADLFEGLADLSGR